MTTRRRSNTDALASALDLPRVELWSPVTVTMDESASFESAHLWLASQPRPYEGRHIRLNVSTTGIKIIDRGGIDTVVARLRARGVKL